MNLLLTNLGYHGYYNYYPMVELDAISVYSGGFNINYTWEYNLSTKDGCIFNIYD